MRALTAQVDTGGEGQREAARAGIGLPARDPGPLRRLIATLPALEVPRPDWPAEAVLVGPCTSADHRGPRRPARRRSGGGGGAVDRRHRHGRTGRGGAVALVPGRALPAGARLVVSRLDGLDVAVPPWATVARVRQDELLQQADVVVCGVVTECCPRPCSPVCRWSSFPAGAIGGSWRIVLCDRGSGRLVRPLTGDALAAAVGEVLSVPGYRGRRAPRRAGLPRWMIRYGCAMPRLDKLVSCG